METKPLIIPLLNPNEPDGMLVAIHVNEGQSITEGDLLFTLETTKATSDVLAEHAGYVIGLKYQEGDSIRAGDIFAYLADSPDCPSPEVDDLHITGPVSTELPPNLRISQPALALARQNKLILEHLPIGPLITEKMVQELLKNGSKAPISTESIHPLNATSIIIYGGGGHGKALIDLLRVLGTYHIIGIIDDGLQAGENIMGIPVLGGTNALPELYAQGVRLAVNAVGGISNIHMRIQVSEKLAKAGLACPTIVHPTAFVEASARLSAGVQVFPHAYIGSDVQVGYDVIVNTGAIVSHDCVLGDYTNLSPGAILAGNVVVGEKVLIGMGVTINLNVKVGRKTRIGNNATIKSDIPSTSIVRAGAIFPN